MRGARERQAELSPQTLAAQHLLHVSLTTLIRIAPQIIVNLKPCAPRLVGLLIADVARRPMVFYKLLLKRDFGDVEGFRVVKSVYLPAADDDEALALAREIKMPDMLPGDQTELVGPHGALPFR